MNFNALSPEKGDNAKSIKRITLPSFLTKDEYFMLSCILFHSYNNFPFNSEIFTTKNLREIRFKTYPTEISKVQCRNYMIFLSLRFT